MARTVLTAFVPDRDGTAAPAEVDGDDVNGHVVANTGRTVVVVRNNDVAALDVTFLTPGEVDGLPVTDRVVSVPAAATLHFGRFDPRSYGGALQVDVASVELKLQAVEP